MKNEDRKLIEKLAKADTNYIVKDCTFTNAICEDDAMLSIIELLKTQADNTQELLKIVSGKVNEPMLVLNNK